MVFIFSIGFTMFLFGIFLFSAELTSQGTGVIEAEKNIILHAPENSQISKIHVKPGDRVELGQVLVTLDNKSYQDKIRHLKKELLDLNYSIQESIIKKEEYKITGPLPELQTIEQESALMEKKKTASDDIEKIYTNLVSNKLVSQVAFLNSQIDKINSEREYLEIDRLCQWKKAGILDIKVASHEQLLSYQEQKRTQLIDELADFENRLDRLTIRAPFSGIASEVYYKYPGQLTTIGSPILKIDSPEDGFRVVANIDERNIDLVQKGMNVRMKSKVYQSELIGCIEGTVDRVIRPKNLNENSQEKFEVWINITSSPTPPVPATSVDVEIILGSGNIINSLIGRPVWRTDS